MPVDARPAEALATTGSEEPRALRRIDLLGAILLGVFVLHLGIGNLSRLVPVPWAGDDLPLGELLLYAAAAAYLAAHRRAWSSLALITPALLIFVLSYTFGLVTHGFALRPLLYLARLVALMTTAAAVAFVLAETMPALTAGRRCLLLAPYLIAVPLGFAIRLVFPDSIDLWRNLGTVGVSFAGDPHVDRFVSPYLDPNFYATIGMIPLGLAVWLWLRSRRLGYAVFATVVLASILGSGSRSGLFALGATAALVILLEVRRGGRGWRRLVLPNGRTIAACAATLLVLAPFWVGTLATTVVRVTGTATIVTTAVSVVGGAAAVPVVGVVIDPSALARVQTASYGLDILAAHPITGLGYDYLTESTRRDLGTPSLDSSVLATLCNLGILLTVLLTVLVFRSAWSTRRRLAASGDASRAFDWLLAYVGVVVVAASLVNNVLYYQFWLLPVAVMWLTADLVSRADPGTGETAHGNAARGAGRAASGW